MRRLLSLAVVLSALVALPLGAQAAISWFDIFTEVAQVSPPYPGGALEVAVGSSVGGQLLTISGTHFMQLKQCVSGTGSALPTKISCSSSAGTGGSWAAESFFDITYRASVGGPDFAVDSFFDVFCDYAALSGSPEASLVPLHPELPPDDVARYFDISHSGSFFDIFFDVAFSPNEHHRLHLHGECSSLLSVADVSITPTCSSGACRTVFIMQIAVHTNAATCCLDDDSDGDGLIMRITQTGDALGDPVAGETASWGDVKSLYR